MGMRFRVLSVLSGLAFVIAAAAGWVANAARVDFGVRGCNEIPAAEWIHTANCTDAWHISWTMGAITASLVAAAVLLARASRHRHA